VEWLQQLDVKTADWFERLRHSHAWWTPHVSDLSALGGKAVLSLVVIFVVGLLLCLRRYRTAGFVLAAALGGMLLTQAAKSAIGRERPPDHNGAASTDSFPSGHSTLSAVIYLTCALLVTAVVHRRRVRVYIIVASLVITGIVGVSRMYLGRHYLTDVLAGWALGLGWALLCRWVEFHWVLRLERREQALLQRLKAMEHRQQA
jgi:undecaprenyl-diphosphatase